MIVICMKFSLNDVVFLQEKFEMILWNFCAIMIYVLALYVYRCSSYRKEKKFLSKYYCEGTKGWVGSVKYNSFLWSLDRKGSPPLYLFGTVHAPYDLVWRNIPMNAKDALMDSTHVYSEIDLRDPDVIHAIRKCRQLPNNLTLSQVLPHKLHQKYVKTLNRFESRKRKWISKLTQSYFSEYEVQSPTLYNQYERLKPVWLISTILQQWNKFAVKLLFQRKPSLDRHLVQLASELGAYRGGIEDVSMHCDPMDNLGEEMVNFALNVTLHSQAQRMSGKWKKKENDIRRVANLYKCGNPLNTSKLGTLFSEFGGANMKQRLEEIDEYFSRELVYKRNIKMAEKIDAMLKNEEYDNAKMFFAVGAAHFLGNDSVVTMLQEKGYTIRHVDADEDIPATIEKRRLIEKRNLLYQKAKNNTFIKYNREKYEENTPIVIIKKVEKTYVYYYNSGNVPLINIGTLFTTLALSLLTLLQIR